MQLEIGVLVFGCLGEVDGEGEGGGVEEAVGVEGGSGAGMRGGEVLGGGERGEIYLHEGGVRMVKSSEKKDMVFIVENHLRASILFLLCH